jgi:hypothetical protein
MFVAVIAARAVLPAEWPDGVRLIVLVLVGLVTFLPLCAWRDGRLFGELVDPIRRRLQVRRRPSEAPA